MPIPDTSGVPVFADFEMLKNKVNEIVQKYNNLLVELDTLNVAELDAKVIIAGSITGDKIQAGTITADKMDVNELSAISANLGTIVAGLIRGIQIFGSYIATAENTYPRSEMNVAGNLLGAYSSANQYVTINPFLGSPTLQFRDGTNLIGMTLLSDQFGMSSNGKIRISADGDINISSTNGTVYINGVPVNSRLSSLQSQIDDLDARVTALGG